MLCGFSARQCCTFAARYPMCIKCECANEMCATPRAKLAGCSPCANCTVLCRPTQKPRVRANKESCQGTSEKKKEKALKLLFVNSRSGQRSELPACRSKPRLLSFDCYSFSTRATRTYVDLIVSLAAVKKDTHLYRRETSGRRRFFNFPTICATSM